MEDIFVNEERVIDEAEKFLSSDRIETENDKLNYKSLLDEYKKLLKQMMMLIKISDLNHSELNSLSKRLEIASNIDVLTGLYNRRYFDDAYQREWLSAIRSKSSLSAIMVDIDFFKEYNDMYGHLEGDECLKSIARAIQNSAQRPRDMAVRFGGEEFIVLLPDTDVHGAVNVADKILMNTDKIDTKHMETVASKKVTVSLGVASIVPVKHDPLYALIDMSDKALYRAKHDGRNCYRIYS